MARVAPEKRSLHPPANAHFSEDDLMKKGYEMHYYQHHIGDFVKATAKLSDSQTMAYLRLLWMYYDTERPLKPDTKILAFQIGVSVEETELLLNSFFWLAENGWHHTRCDKEIAEYREILEKKSNAGKASAERRKNKRSTDVEQVLISSSTDEQLTNNHKPITNKDKGLASKPDEVSDQIWADFLRVRKAHNAPLTKTAFAKIIMEALKAKMNLEDVLKLCTEKNWRGFEADWLKDKGPKPLDQFAGAL
jgi:uncharacterized protein YdaU (DUF1376 family)